MSTATPTPTPTPAPTTDELGRECVTAVPGENGNVPLGACNSYYNFNPRFEPAVAVATIFGILTLAHFVLAVLYKKPYVWVLIMGGLWETLGFAIHSLGSRDQQNIGYATAHSILYLLAPLWINGFVYMTFGRIVWFFLPEQRVLVKASWMSAIFVIADIATFIVQGVGGVMANPSASVDIINIGLKIYLVGLGLQQGFIVIFVVLMVAFHRRRLQLDAAGEATRYPDGTPKRPWKPLQYAMYATLALISVRIIFRLVEFSGGITPSNPIPFHEEYSYALDAFPMMVCLLIMAIFHPGRTLVGPGASFPSRKEKKQKKSDKKEAKKAAKDKLKNGKGGFVEIELSDANNRSVPDSLTIEHPSPVHEPANDHQQTQSNNPWRN